MQPFTVAFSDHLDGQPAEPVTGLIAFDNWAVARPVQKRFLSPFPGYTEKVLSGGADGDKTPIVEKLHMYVAEARFVITRPPRVIDLAPICKYRLSGGHRRGDQAPVDQARRG